MSLLSILIRLMHRSWVFISLKKSYWPQTFEQYVLVLKVIQNSSFGLFPSL